MSAGSAFQLVAVDILQQKLHSAGEKSSLFTTFTWAPPGFTAIQDLAQSLPRQNNKPCAYLLCTLVYGVARCVQSDGKRAICRAESDQPRLVQTPMDSNQFYCRLWAAVR